MKNKNILDCGDNSCLFAKTKGGMRTNGRCRCLDLVGSALQRKIEMRFSELQRELNDLEDQLLGSRDVHADTMNRLSKLLIEKGARILELESIIQRLKARRGELEIGSVQ